MDRNQPFQRKDDLYESGKAFRNSLFGGGNSGNSGGSSTVPPQGTSFPGIPYGQEPYGPGWAQPPSQLPVPYQAPAKPSSPLGMLGNLPLKDIKSFVDRMGGIEGIMNTVTKMNSLMKNVQQMAPMIKLLMGSFFKSKTADSTSDLSPRRRRKRRRRGKSRSGSSGYSRYSRSSYSRRSTSSRRARSSRYGRARPSRKGSRSPTPRKN